MAFEEMISGLGLAAALAAPCGVLAWWSAMRLRACGRAAGAQRERQEQLQAALDRVGDGVVTADAGGLVLRMNPAAERLTGWPAAEACGRRCEEVLRLVDEETRRPAAGGLAARARSEGGAPAARGLLLARDGREVPVEACATPGGGPGGTGAVIVVRDRSDARAAQRALDAERASLRTLLTASPVALLVLDTELCVVDANPAAERLFERTLAASEDRTCGGFLGCANPTHEAECGRTEHCPTCALRQARREVLETGAGVYDREIEYVYARAGEPKRRWLLFSMVEVALGGRRCLLVELGEMTRHRQTEEALRRIEWMLSKKPPPAAPERDAGGAEGEGWAPSGGRIGAAVGREMLANIVAEFLDLLGTASAIHEADGACVYRRVECGWCRLLASAPRPGGPGQEDGAWKACLEAAAQARGPAENPCACGMRLYAVPVLVRGDVVGTIGFSFGDPVRGPAGVRTLAECYGLDAEALLREALAYDVRPTYIVEMAKARLRTAAWLIGTLVEAHEAQAERAKLEAQFRHAQKMEAIGRLAGGVAHDFNNILQGIIGYGELLTERLPETEETRDFATEIVVEGKRAATLTRQLLAFARKQASDPRVLDLNEAVAVTLKMLRRLLGEDIELTWKPCAERCLVKVDPGQFEQILANLAVNSRDAIDGVGRITIEARVIDAGEEAGLPAPGLRPGRYARLSVSDTGCGMEPDVLEHLFEPFFTTKARGRGTGLGLATVYGIVEQSGGTIRAESEPGRGATFFIYLPERSTSEAAPAALTPGGGPVAGTETVLIVDDEETLLRSARRILEGLGYTVLAAGSPEEAIRLAQSYHQSIHVLLTDVVMPGMSGRDLWLRLEALRPDMTCVFMSGYTANIIAQRGTLNKGVHFLQKPFTKAALASKLREALAAGPQAGA